MDKILRALLTVKAYHYCNQNAIEMLRDLKSALVETGHYLFLALKALYFWRKEPPVTNVEELVAYVDSRSKFVAQTTLFGYIKTRAGMKYAALYDDPLFTQSVNMAKWEIWLACLCDLATYTVASIGRRAGVRVGELDALAIHIVDRATRMEDVPAERPQGFGDIRAAYEKRARATAWNEIEPGEGPFEASLSALVEWAPVADELKILDEEIVRNSMRFKWKSVRGQFEELIDADSVLESWRREAREEPRREVVEAT